MTADVLQLAVKTINKVRELVACYVLYNQRSYSVANFKYNIKVSVLITRAEILLIHLTRGDLKRGKCVCVHITNRTKKLIFEK